MIKTLLALTAVFALSMPAFATDEVKHTEEHTTTTEGEAPAAICHEILT